MLQQQQFALEKSMYALKEAQSLFLPKVSLQADYFLAGGGRTVDFPAGDILNPVYATLNQLTEGNNFPTVENQRILLNPNISMMQRSVPHCLSSMRKFSTTVGSNQI